MSFQFKSACGCYIGNRRSNQDNFYFNKKHLPVKNKGLKSPLKLNSSTDEPLIFAVFDGMGGESKGEDASCLTAEVFGAEAKKLEELVISGKEFLHSTCFASNSAVNAFRKKNQLGTVGTTVASIFLSQDEVVACNVGDSKIFRIREGQMLQISEDHTDEKIMSAVGVNKKPVLLQYIGLPEDELTVEPYIAKCDIRKNDAYVICSDGVTDVVSVGKMFSLICGNEPYDAVGKILTEVKLQNGQDNATVIIIKFD